jgi:geranylgeranyl diphosphate synthase, type II
VTSSRDLLEERLLKRIGGGQALAQAMSYALSGGKRIRPLLVIAAAETLGADVHAALDPACAVEMVHAYSLIHDDLPCMDNDDFRRGRPTVHRVFPEAIAVLAGDALLTEAFWVLSHADKITDRQKVRLIELLARHSGREGMVGGQAIDILSAEKPLSNELMKEMALKKTGDLLSCCLEFGAVISSAGHQIEELMRQIGLDLGLAYQLRDDLEDQRNPSDANKSTFVTILGIQRAQELLRQSIQNMDKNLKALPHGALPLKAILDPIF